MVPVQFSVGDIIALIEFSRKLWVAFDKGPRGASEDFKLLFKEYTTFVQVFGSLKTFFESQSVFHYDFGLLETTLDRLKVVLDKYRSLGEQRMTREKVFDTIAYPFRQNEIKNLRQHLSRHHESLMLYFAQQTLQVTHETRSAAIDTRDTTAEIHRMVTDLRTRLDNYLPKSPKKTSVSPDPRISPGTSPSPGAPLMPNGQLSRLPPSAMDPMLSDEQYPPYFDAYDSDTIDLPALPEVSALTHMTPAEVERLRAILQDKLALRRRSTIDSGLDVASYCTTSTPITRRSTLGQHLRPTPATVESPNGSLSRPRSTSRPSSEVSPNTSPRQQHLEMNTVNEEHFEPGPANESGYLSNQHQLLIANSDPYWTPGQSPPVFDASDPHLGFDPSGQRLSHVGQRSSEWEFFCNEVSIKSEDDRMSFNCRRCSTKQPSMTLKKRTRSNGNLKLQLSCSNCSHVVLEHECRHSTPLIPKTFYTGDNKADSLAVFFESCSGHQVPGRDRLVKPKYYFKQRENFIKFQELIYGARYIGSWNVSWFEGSDHGEWQDETVRLFRNAFQELSILFPLVFHRSHRTGFFDANKSLFERCSKDGKRAIELRFKKPENVLQQLLTRSSSLDTSGSNSRQTWHSNNSTSSTTSVANSCICYNPGRRSSQPGPINWTWVKLTFTDAGSRDEFYDVWNKG